MLRYPLPDTTLHQQSHPAPSSSSSKSMGEAATDVVVVVVPFPAQGHLNQLLHFCRLVSAHDIPAHFVGSATHNRQVKTRLHGWHPRDFPTIQFHDFQIPPYPIPPPNPKSTVRFPTHLQPAFDAALLHLRPQLRLLLRSLSATARRVVVVHDSLMSFVAHESVDLPNAETYAFHSVSAFANLMFQWESRGKLREQSKKLFPKSPVLTSDGCFTRDFVDFIRRQHRLTAADNGRIINTSRSIEGKFVDLFADEPILENKTLYAIGPLHPVFLDDDSVATVEEEEEREDLGFHRKSYNRHECLRWLDKQPPSSVLYVSFGTTSSLCRRQIDEITDGLDRSQQRFVWVLREADRGDIFAGDDDVTVHEKTQLLATGRGIVVRDWTPQLEILAHPSTGGFLTHCGWNSCIESMSFGVPMIVWPMHSDQPRNALMVTDILRVGISIRDWSRRDEIVSAWKVENAARRLMDSSEGKAMRTRAKSLSGSVRQSVSKGGSSRKDLDDFITHVTRP